MNNEINLAWMYPDILNLHGERGNSQSFKKVADKLNIKLNIQRIDDLEQKIDFSNYDILLFNSGELKVIPSILQSLNGMLDELNEYIKNKKTIIVTGTTGALLANTITRYDNSSYSGLKLLNMDIKERTMVIGDDLYYTLEDGTQIIGSQIQMVDITLNDEKPLGTIKYGYGNNGQTTEGATKDNIIFTNCLGPVFVKNPWFVEKILKAVCKQKGIEISEDIHPNYEIETKSLESTKEFINKKISSQKEV
ncbi:MAG TPA: hypothetical protein DCZ30_07410 [Clostridiales bacterium]|nr:hypothetical protein [Clostridiales bacterium]